MDKIVESPLDPGDYPELDTSKFLEENGIQIYQSLIALFQWAISIGQWDIMTAITSLQFRTQLLIDHLEIGKRVYTYLLKNWYYRICFNVPESNHKTTLEYTKRIGIIQPTIQS